MRSAPFKRVILYARQHRVNQEVYETLQRLVAFLREQNIKTYLHADTSAIFELDAPVLQNDDMHHQHDLIVVVGGDGSLLSAARLAVNVHVPVIGINRGRLGFLTDISPQEMEVQLKNVLNGEYIEESRTMLQLTLDDDIDYRHLALNDIVLSRGIETHLIAFDVYMNEQFVSHYRSDGLILATPTGSTAYALSAGGPILHPQLNAMVVVPMFPHSLNARPLVIDSQTRVRIKVSEENDMDLSVSCDGHKSMVVHPGQSFIIEKYPQPLRLLHPKNYHYYETLRIKLGWGTRNLNHANLVAD